MSTGKRPADYLSFWSLILDVVLSLIFFNLSIWPFAHSYSADKTVSPKMITNIPGPGRTSRTRPAISRTKPVIVTPVFLKILLNLSTYPNMFTARAVTSTTVSREISAWMLIRAFAAWVKGMVSVGEKAVELVSETYR